MLKYESGKKTCVCGIEFEWRTYFLENGEVVTGFLSDLKFNVINQTKL